MICGSVMPLAVAEQEKSASGVADALFSFFTLTRNNDLS
jgi:hypothetical protein